MIKVNYDQETTLVKGYYPDTIKYKEIPEPYIEIQDKDQDNTKTMCVVNGVYQGYIKPDNIKLRELRSCKIAICRAYLESKDWLAIRSIDVPGSYPQSVKDARTAARLAINDIEKLTTLEEVEGYDISKFQ